MVPFRRILSRQHCCISHGATLVEDARFHALCKFDVHFELEITSDVMFDCYFTETLLSILICALDGGIVQQNQTNQV